MGNLVKFDMKEENPIEKMTESEKCECISVCKKEHSDCIW